MSPRNAAHPIFFSLFFNLDGRLASSVVRGRSRNLSQGGDKHGHRDL